MILMYWIFLVGLGLVAALNPVPHQMSEESLRTALNAVTRKQRSLNTNPQAYYDDLPLFKYQEDNGERNFQRQQVGSDEIDDNKDSLAFIPSEGTGQLETIGDGYQHLNNKQFNRALMDYLQYVTDQEVPSQSVFRERERNANYKRAANLNHGMLNEKELARILMDGGENDLAHDQEELDDQDYQRALEMIYDKYKIQPDNEAYGGDQLLLRELFSDENREESQEPRFVQISPAERRNVNARYPLFNREYKTYHDSFKRLPVFKRSAKAVNRKRQVTDPKVAEDLGSLFGTQSTSAVNHTHDQSHDHNHDHSHDHNHEHNHDRVKGNGHSGQTQGSNVETSNSTAKSKNLKDNMAKVNKTKERPIDVKKKSVDWSQYFGIDRRKKKTVYMGRPDTQDQDEEYLLQKYYETMAENLNLIDKDGGEKRDKLQQMDSKLKNMKNQMIEEAMEVGLKNNVDSQEVKDEIMSRLSAAYSFEKLRRALKQLSSNAAAQRESQRAAQAQNNLTLNHPNSANVNKNEDKRTRNNVDAMQGIDDESSCLQIDLIERRCKMIGALIGDVKQLLLVPCVLYNICNSCDQDDCLERFAFETEKICQEKYSADSSWLKYCLKGAMLIPYHSPTLSKSSVCRLDESDLCLTHQNRYRHRYLYDNSYRNHLIPSKR
ncbi:PREDICTED: uncharacterized protein LOC105359131 [Ceratosolen solmsi marchali]|uniref:Uncharacterized protein LOC105359131 n=1 Tax=Ceratosolen solmsi marchali TaxID=326594 RepID=A0AAJ6YB39_9HYME|nr:PREDICTED: uncharacterized protein LOC105359131 [Ceratosolen solmsi marchali]